MTRALLAAFVLTLCAIDVAGAQSLKAARAKDAEFSRLSQEASYTNKMCDASFSARIDWAASRNWPPAISLAEACNGALGAIEAMCRSKEGKAQAGRIAVFTCAGDGRGPVFAGGEMRFGANPRGDSYASMTRFLEAKF